MPAASCVPPVIVTHPVSQSIDAGLTLTLTVLANGSNPKSYVWQKDNVVIGGANTSTLQVGNVNAGDAGVYKVIVRNACGEVLSNAANVTLTSGTCIIPFIGTHPQSVAANHLSNVTFSVVVTGGTPPFSYQWRKDGVAIPGATTASYNVVADPSAAGNYSVVVTNACGTAISANGLLTVVNIPPTCTPPVITTHPLGQEVAHGDNVTFSVAATGTPTFGYQWRKNGTNISGATLPSILIIYAEEDDQGQYSVVVTNACGSATSANALLVVANIVPPSSGTGGGAGVGTLVD